MTRMFFYATDFNQCLSSWAQKTSPTVDTFNMFQSTACPNGNNTPDPTSGPWCQGANEGCVASLDCSDKCPIRPKVEQDGDNFRSLIDDCINNNNCPDAYDYGNIPIGCWDVSGVTNMTKAFSGLGYISYFDKPLKCWDVSSVEDMASMFLFAYQFNQALNNWDVSGVKDMSDMFGSSSEFNQPLNDWNVAGVKNMGLLFSGTNYFNQPLNNWNVSSVTNMDGIFRVAFDFNQLLNDWDVSGVKNMTGMFYYATNFNQCLSSWAQKTSPTVDTFIMFGESTACPNGNNTPDPTSGPWCQGANEGCVVPDLCTNDPDFKANGKDCELFLQKKKSNKCNTFKKGKLVSDSCPAICKEELCTCKDRSKKIKVPVKGKIKKLSCTQIKNKGFCQKKDKNKKMLFNLCPESCVAQCLNK